MDIATKLTQIAEKEAENIELNNQLEQTLYGTDTGGKSYYDEFWDSVQQNGNRVMYRDAFAYWNCEYLHPKYKVIPKWREGNTTQLNMYSMCQHMHNLKKIEKQYFDLSQYEPENDIGYASGSTHGNYYIFASCPKLEIVEDVGMKPYSYHYTFADDTSLHTVEVLRFNGKTQINGQPFRNCKALKNITIEGEICVDFSFIHSPLLSKESITSIITHLSDTQGATLTLKAEAVNNAFGGEYATEWIELIAPKSNQYNGLWTINLV